jgi:hypothetical protein
MASRSSAYYQTHKDEIKARMRERDAAKREAAREARMVDGEAAESQRAEWRLKYERRGQRAVKAQIDAWLASPDTTDAFKTFLRQSMLPEDAYRAFTPKMLDAIKCCAILRPVPPPENSPSAVDGPETE